ncbi:sugar ABC transporter substrate-binding protein [Curtobacterium sp. MCPF17_046]|uniref:ABC transporter substrate-binding protein n=1 Tax=Curtobacterium sp. MCPF17_046 TaxID=2175663 RepID=UPI0021AC4F19|nr:sugar ABC transporter substrate-binding protein [Curtobacterium sp. MCPF17_046]
MMLRRKSGTRAGNRGRILAGTAVAVASALVLSACGAGGGDGGGSAKSLTVLVEAGGHGELQPIADRYKKETGTKVQFVELPYDGLYNRVNSELNSGSVSFDVAALDAIWLPTFKEGLTPLNSLFTEDVEKDLFPAELQEGKIGGDYVGMPAWTNTEILYYRKDLLDDPANKTAFKEKYGYDLKPPTTWEQYQDEAEFFTKDGMYGTATKGAVETEYLAALSQAGEKDMVVDDKGNVTLGDAASLKALDFYTSMLKSSAPGAAQTDWAAAQNLFYQGKTALMLFWGHAYRQIPEDSKVSGKVGVAPMIAGPAGVAGVPGPYYLSVPKASPNQDAAEEFIKFAYEHNDLSATTDLGLAARVSAFEKYQDKPGYEAFKPMVETLQAEGTIPRPSNPKWQQIVDNALVPMLQQAVRPGADNQQLLDQAKTKVEDILK